MDDIKRIDLVDIELTGGSLHRSWCKHSIGKGDIKANAFGVRVFRDGEAVNLSGGSVQGHFLDSQGNKIAITNSSFQHVAGNVAYIILPQACYNYEGQFTLAIKLINSTLGITGTMRIVDGMVDNTNTGGEVAPTESVPTYEEVLAVYDEMVAAKEGSVRFDITQSLTGAQKTTARENIDAVGNNVLANAAGYSEDMVKTHSDNLFDGKIIPGTVINQTTGSAQTSDSYKATVFIRIKPCQDYVISASSTTGLRYALYDESQTYITGALEDEDFETPSNAAYIRFSVLNAAYDIQLEEGTTASEYEDYSASIKKALIADESIDEERTTFFTRSGNLIDPEKVTYGEYVNQTTGAFQTSETNARTDYLEIKPDTTYCLANYLDEDITIRYAFYTKGKIFLSGGTDTLGNLNYLLTSPIDAYYLVVSATNPRFPMMVKESSTAVSYEAFDTKLKASRVPAITPEQTTFFERGINLVDPDTCVPGYYVNQSNGSFVANDGYIRSDYIPVENGKKYAVARIGDGNGVLLRYAFYDEDKTFITDSGDYIQTFSGGGLVITAPGNARYMVASVGNAYFPFMIAESKEKIPYSAYYNRIKAKYLDQDGELIHNLPSKLYGLVGYETNIYFENIVEDWTKYEFNVIAYKGRQMKRGFSFTPTANDVGTLRIEIEVYKNKKLLKTLVTVLYIGTTATGDSKETSVIILGDSTTDNGTAVSKLNENTASGTLTVHTLGTRGTGNNKHEGRSGWTFDTYFTKASITYTDGRGTVYNPFYNPSTETFDADYYFTNSGVSEPDWFFINLGINDMFSYLNDDDLKTQIATCKAMCDSMIASVKAAASSTKIGVCITIPPNDSQDAFGKAYGCGQTRNRYKRNNLLWANALINAYQGREDSNIYLVPIHLALDTVYNMGLENTPVNARNETTYVSPIANGGVHPAESGYWQIADVYTAFLKVN